MSENYSPLSTAAKNTGKVEKVMNEFKSGSLNSSSGKPVTSHAQAIAIALSEARRMAEKK